jgi:hypothetical protein
MTKRGDFQLPATLKIPWLRSGVYEHMNRIIGSKKCCAKARSAVPERIMMRLRQDTVGESIVSLSITCALLFFVAMPTQAGEDVPVFRTKFDREIVLGQPSLICTRVEKGPLIDGQVDEDPVWQNCGRTRGAWTQLGQKVVTERQTVVYSCFDKQNVYFGFVCEEPELQNLQVNGELVGTGPTRPGADDCVEVVIEVGGVQGTGDVYSFRANSRAQSASWGFTGIPGNANISVPKWKSAGKMAAKNRWMMELAIPFSSLKRTKEQDGLSSPTRGEVWGLKLVRWGAEQTNPNDRMISTWNTEIAIPLVYVVGCNGLMFFEDSNSLKDSSLAAPEAESPWQRKGDVNSLPDGGVSIGEGGSITQVAAVRPGSFYLLTVDADNTPNVLVNGHTLNTWLRSRSVHPGKQVKSGIWTEDKQTELKLTIEAGKASKLKSLKLLHQPGEEPLGPYCLTGNYRTADRNIRNIVPDAPLGSYRYVMLDYQNRTIGEDHPQFGKKGNNTVVEDRGGVEGWIPFNRGSLTGRPEIILWNFLVVPEPKYQYGIHTHAVEIDLGQEYFVHGLDILASGSYYCAFEVWGKEKEADDWIYLHANGGSYVDPAKRAIGYSGFKHLRGVDSVVRYLRWRWRPANFDAQESYRGSVCIDGLQEFWVWGEPKGQHAGIKAFKPWVPPEDKTPATWTTTAPDPDACQIVPRPQKVEKRDGWFIIGPATRIVAQRAPEAQKNAKQIQDEIRRRWEIEVPIVDEPSTIEEISDAIYLGQPDLSAIAAELEATSGLKIQKSPQAYVLSASPKKILLLGGDRDSLYWAVQSLMLAMRWHSSKNPSQQGLGIRCMAVTDWPATPERSLFYYKGYMMLFDILASEVSAVELNAHLQTRFKFNVSYSSTNINGSRAAAWPQGLLEATCRTIREKYHMEIRPELLDWAAGGWKRIAGSTEENVSEYMRERIFEIDPDEAAADLGEACNICPLEPETYALAFKNIDEKLDQFGRPSAIWLNGIALADHLRGSRWGVCRSCQKSGKTPEELYLIFAHRIAAHLRTRNVRGVLESHNLNFGRNDNRKQLLRVNASALPSDLELVLPCDNSREYREFLEENIPRSTPTVNGPPDWPSIERRCVSQCNQSEIRTSAALLAKLIPIMDEYWHGTSSSALRSDDADFKDAHIAIAGEQAGCDMQDLTTWLNCWNFRRELPSWRAGDRPTFVPIDIRKYVNSTSIPEGLDRVASGRPPPLNLRNLPAGEQVLSGVKFDIIDPKMNGGKSMLVLGRPPKEMTHAKDAANIAESAGPISVGRKLASLVFLRARWKASVQSAPPWSAWLLPVCRVVYEDGSWLTVDCFPGSDAWEDWSHSSSTPIVNYLLWRVGWSGKTPAGQAVVLRVIEWVNPYPEKQIKEIHFSTPGFEEAEGRKRTSNHCEVIVAISGVEPIDQDYRFWAKSASRPPLLPVFNGYSTPGTLLGRVSDPRATGLKLKLANKQVQTDSTLVLTPNASILTAMEAAPISSNDCGQIRNATDCFEPFGVTQSFETPIKLCRVEVRGPTFGIGVKSQSLGRNHRLDVELSISEDGEHWRKCGELRGISADADFQAIEFSPATLKKIRLTATAAPYRRDYPAGYDAAADVDYPFFVWRLVAADASK